MYSQNTQTEYINVSTINSAPPIEGPASKLLNGNDLVNINRKFIEILQQESNQSQLRNILYSVYSVNRFVNEDYAIGFQYLCDALVSYRNLSFTDIYDKVRAICCVLIVSKYPNIRNSLDQATMQLLMTDCSNEKSMLENAIITIARSMAGNVQQGWGNQMPQQNPAQGWFNPQTAMSYINSFISQDSTPTNVTSGLAGLAKNAQQEKSADTTMRTMDDVTQKIGHYINMPSTKIVDSCLESENYIPLITSDYAVLKDNDSKQKYIVVNKDTQMDYTKHEQVGLNTKGFKDVKSGPRNTTEARWHKVSSPNLLIELKDDIVDVDMIQPDSTVFLKEPIETTSLQDGEYKAFKAFKNYNVSNLENKVLEYKLNINTLLTCSKEDVSQIFTLQKSNSVTKLLDIFSELEIDRNTWHLIDNSFNRLFLRRMRVGVDMPIKTYSGLIATYSQIMTALRDKLNESALDRFKDNLLTLMLKVVTVRQITEGDVLTEKTSVTYLPWNADQIELHFPDHLNYGMLSEVIDANFYSSIKALIQRNNDCLRHFIYTSDRVLFEVHKSDLNTNTYVVELISKYA